MLAYCLSVHKNPKQVSRLMSSIYNSEDLYYFNIVGADSNKKREEWMKYLQSYEKGNVFFSFKYSNSWGTIDMVRAPLDAMNHFQDFCYSYFINLSGQCYPIASISSIKEFFSKNKCSFIAYNKMPDYCQYAKDKNIYFPPNTKYHYRFEYCYYPIPHNYIFDFFKGFFNIRKDINQFIKIPRLNKKLLYSLELFKGSNWFCLHKDHVRYILDFLKDNPDYIKFFGTVLCSDEHFFQIILLNSPLKSQIVNDNLRYIPWNSTHSAPVTLDVNNLTDIFASKKFFARKFDIEIDSEVLDAIDLNNKKNNEHTAS
jgi:hypothetical protein